MGHRVNFLRMCAWAAACWGLFGTGALADGQSPLTWELAVQVPRGSGLPHFHRRIRRVRWLPAQTAVIVCDMWDAHHGLQAARRVAELAVPIDRFLKAARSRGITVIHAPSGCMAFYADHPARRRALAVPRAKSLPDRIDSWCEKIASEEGVRFPIDDQDGGEDDEATEHDQWHAQLRAQGRNPKRPWKRQIATITIDPQRDYITDRGSEIWSLFEHHGIRHVLLVGVHTNMCVLGRPFGLRQLVRCGKEVALVRDLTDTMYNPAQAPRVSHFSGTDLVLDYIERYICPTVTSDQLCGGEPFRFRDDRRPHLVVLIAEDEYQTDRTLPAFLEKHCRARYRITYCFGTPDERHTIVGLDRAPPADVCLVSVRRRALPPAQMAWLRRHVAAGKGMVGIRTASHAFHLRGRPAPSGRVLWESFDPEVWGGHYDNHYGNQRKPVIRIVQSGNGGLFASIVGRTWRSGGSLYKTRPLHPAARPVATGTIEGKPAEPVAWTFIRRDGGRSFYTSLGHRDDFRQEAFVTMLEKAIDWASGIGP